MAYEDVCDYHGDSRIAKICEQLKQKHGAGNYRVHSNGTIYIFGAMPDNYFVGWYLFGSIDSIERQTRINTLIAAARQARALTRRFERKGETFNANQARVISLRALQNARGIKSGLI